jgi:hypothetical protein
LANGNDTWVKDGLPIDGDWESACGCAPAGPPTSTVANLTITGAPGGVTSVANSQALWTVLLNDGTPQVDFAIQRFNSGQLIDSPITIERSTGIVTFHDPVMLSEDPQQPMEAVTKEYVDSKGGVLSWNNRAGDVTMTTTDITVTLGYSPYDAANPSGYQTAAQVQAAINFAVPQPSNNLPGMDGTAASGQANQWSRYDHIHPHDTSLLPLVGGTLTGNLFVPTLVATTGIAGTSGGAPPVLFSDPPAADASAMVPTTRWVQAALTAHGGGSSVTIGDTAPATPKAGDLWWDSVGGQLYVWFQDANSSQWVVANNSGSAARLTIGDVAPSAPHAGDMWFDSVGAQTYVWFTDADTSQWVILNNFSGGAYLPKQGVTDGSSAPAGQIGEFISNNAANVSLPSGTAATLVGLTLSAGDWEVWGSSQIASTTVSLSQFIACLNTVTNTLASPFAGLGVSSAILAANSGVEAVRQRFNVTVSTNVYLVVQVGFASGSCTVNGWIYARRAR